MSLLPSALVLGLAALVAATLTRGRAPGEVSERKAAARALAIATVVQSLHFVEEAGTGFPDRFGPVFGLPEMSEAFFLSFNVGWIVLWLASVPGVRAGWRSAFFPAWFLAIAGMVNGVAHPALAVATRGYFPGLLTSPLGGIAGLYLWSRLTRATAPRGTHDGEEGTHEGSP